MCGIFGYFGQQEACPLLIGGLKRLEYRGYDSAGMTVKTANGLYTIRRVGKVRELEAAVMAEPPKGHIGLAHTRWATHGVVSEQNSHPHVDCHGAVAVVHNGIIDNYRVLRELLEKKGHRFASETDTEVLPHLIEEHYKGSLEGAVCDALARVEGTYGLVVVHANENKVVAARCGSPLVFGIGKGEYFIASDPTSIAEHTRDVIYLDDGDVLVIDEHGYRITDRLHAAVIRDVKKIDWDVGDMERGEFSHFMLKEIHEQPARIFDTWRGRFDPTLGMVHLGGLRDVSRKLARAKMIVISSCGTSWHAGMVGEYLIETIAGVPVEVEYSTEFICKRPLIGPGDVFIAVSQSGETADTLAALKLAQSQGALVLGIVNVVGSTIARETDAGVYIHVGPEVGVASTKAFTGHLTAFVLLASYLAQLRRVPNEVSHANTILNELTRIPLLISEVLQRSAEIETLAQIYQYARNFLYLGRGINFPIALEGALKLKEISYIHAEGIPSAEMKHGPISLVDNDMPVLFIMDSGVEATRVLTNMEEIKSRKGKIVVIAPDGEERVRQHADHILWVPRTHELLSPFINVVPLQLLAYYVALLRGCDVDKPRNLAKAVTVQ